MGDEDAIAELARRAHTDTRFFFDPGFSPQRAGDLYATWARRGLDEDSRHLLVAERDGRLLGYVLIADDPLAIDLIAVADSARRQGIGRALVAAAPRQPAGEPGTVVT